MSSCSFNFAWLISSFHRSIRIKGTHHRVFGRLKQVKILKQYINKLSTEKICCYSVDNYDYLYIIFAMSELHFWGECKKTLERDLPVEEYTTWIAPLTLEQNNGSNPLSYSVLAPNKFISDWVEDNYGTTIKERLSAITSNVDLNLNFEIFVDYHENNNQIVLEEIDESKQDLNQNVHTQRKLQKKQFNRKFYI